jgi:uncharacterized protein (TIGR00369 family)
MTNRSDVLQRWQKEEAMVRARLAAPGVTSPQELKASSGIEFLQRIFDGELPSPPIGETLGFVPIAAEPGRVVFQGTPEKRHYNPLGGVHGGYFCTLLDSALGCAIHSMLPKGTGYTTLELNVNLIRSLTDEVGPVRAEGKAIHVGSRMGIAEGDDHRRRREALRACDHDLPHFPASLATAHAVRVGKASLKI